MNSVQNIRVEKFQIRAYEIDTAGRLSIAALCDYMQEIAGNHARALGVGFEALLKQNMIWVLSRLFLLIDTLPRWSENISIETWPAVAEGKFALRDFLFNNAKDQVFGRATTSWMVLDLQQRKAIALPQSVHQIQRPVRERALVDPFVKLPTLERIDWQKKYQVCLSDLDLNFHVNNVSYIRWALDAIPLNIWQAQQLYSMEISFRAESHLDEMVTVQIGQSDEKGDLVLQQHLIRETDLQELAVVRSRWKRNGPAD
jgi:medium-chain acyl-[acyl-carrier-protein] hydrolase